MIKIKRVSSERQSGLSLVLLWLVSLTGIFHMDGKGDHMHFAFGIGPFELSLGATIWRTLP